jgi:hypothetical protein
MIGGANTRQLCAQAIAIGYRPPLSNARHVLRDSGATLGDTNL